MGIRWGSEGFEGQNIEVDPMGDKPASPGWDANDAARMGTDRPRQIWKDLLHSWSVPPIRADITFEEIPQACSGSGRFYHTLDHIIDVLARWIVWPNMPESRTPSNWRPGCMMWFTTARLQITRNEAPNTPSGCAGCC
jgi:hypothetical protein